MTSSDNGHWMEARSIFSSDNCCGGNSGPRKKRQQLLHDQPLRRLGSALDRRILELTSRLDSKSIITSDGALTAITNCAVVSSVILPLSMPTFWDMHSTVATWNLQPEWIKVDRHVQRSSHRDNRLFGRESD